MIKVGRADDRFHDTLTSRSIRSNHFRRDVGRAGVRASNGNCIDGHVTHTRCNGGFIPDIILLTLCDYIEEPLSYHEEFLSLQPMFPPKYFDKFSPEGGCVECLDAFRLKTKDTMSLDYSSVCNIGSRIVWASMREVY